MNTNAPTHRHSNRLIDETSPYLQQHAHNPVDWYPWSAEALERARVENKPILVSIGYSACHWCHVMEHESFEDEEEEPTQTKDEVEKPAPRKKPANVVAPVTRSTAPRQVRLTPTQVAIAKKLGLSNEQYAKELLKLESN